MSKSKSKRVMHQQLSNTNAVCGVSYTRVSTIGQLKDGKGRLRDDASPEIQAQRCTDYMKFLKDTDGEARDYTIIKHLCDGGKSGKSANRSNYQNLLDFITSHQISFVIGTEYSRMTRNLEDFIQLINLCEKHQVRLIVIGLSLDTSTPVGKMVALILMTVYQAEREICGQRVRENALARLVSSGKINGSAPILGLERDPDRSGHFRINTKEVATLERILQLALATSSRKELLQKCHDEGLTNKEGQPLSSKVIETILTNVKWRYRGLWYLNKENEHIENQDHLPENKRFRTVPLPHGPVVDINLLDQVQAKMEDSWNKHKRTGSDRYTYLLSHILYDENDNRLTGQSAFGRSGQRFRYYANTTKKTKMRVRCEEIDEAITKRIKQYFNNSPLFEEMLERGLKRQNLELPTLQQELVTLKRELEEIEMKEEQLRQKLLIFDHNGKEEKSQEFFKWLEDQVNLIQESKKTIQKKQEHLKTLISTINDREGLTNIKETAKAFIERFDDLTGTEKRNLIEKMIHKIIIRSDNQVELYVNWSAVGESTNKKGHTKMACNIEERCSYKEESGGSEGTRTLGLLRDRQY